MARKRRQGEIFSMSFLDCMSCGFGAVILVFMIINSHSDVRSEEQSVLQAETDKLHIEVLDGRKNLALKRTQIQKLETEQRDLDDQISVIKALIAELQAELAKYDNDTLAKIRAIEKLQSDIKSLEEEVKRLLAIKKEQDALGEQIRTFRGDGDRQYLTGLKLGGERTLILVDRSASMLHETIVNVIRRKNLPDAEKVRSRKWRQVVTSVDWLTSQFKAESEFQIYMFNNVAEPVLKGTDGVWLKADDGAQIDEAIRVLRRTPPDQGTNLHAAFEIIKTMNPRPDNVILLVDGMPTTSTPEYAKSTVGGQERLRIFTNAVQQLPSGIPINIMLYSMEGDFYAPTSFWALALRTQGSFMSVSRDWP